MPIGNGHATQGQADINYMPKPIGNVDSLTGWRDGAGYKGWSSGFSRARGLEGWKSGAAYFSPLGLRKDPNAEWLIVKCCVRHLADGPSK